MERSNALTIEGALQAEGIDANPTRIECAFHSGVLAAIFDPKANYRDMEAIRKALGLPPREGDSDRMPMSRSGS